MSNTNLPHVYLPKSKKFVPLAFSINPNSTEGREAARDLIRAHFRFIINNLNFQKNRRKYLGQLTDINMWLTEDDLLRTDPHAAELLGISAKTLNCDLSMLGQMSFSIKENRVSVKVDRRRYQDRVIQARKKEQRLRLAADLLKKSVDLAEVA